MIIDTVLENFVGKRLAAAVLATVLAAFLATGLAGLTSADTLHSVTLLYFRGFPQEDGIALEWATASENDTVGFRIERSLSSGGPFVEADSIGFVQARGDALIGASYAELDRDALQNGTTYYYRLIEVELSGAENREGPLAVERSAQNEAETPTSSPQTTATSSPASTPSPSSTSTTPIPTATNTRSGGQRNEVTTPAATSGPGPTVSPISRLAQVDEFAQEVPTATPELAYPGPQGVGDDAVRSPDESAYPAPITSDGPSPTEAVSRPQLNTEPEEVDDGQRLEVDGEQFSTIGQDEEAGQGVTAQQPVDRSARTTLLLWLGFFAALLVFIAGVFGSIILYARKRTRDR